MRTRSTLAVLGAWMVLIVLLGCGGHHHHRLPNVTEYVQYLDRPERDAHQKPAEVIAALELAPGMTVADLGAGSGYFTWRLAEAIGPTGGVLAVDIEPAMEAYIHANVQRARGPAPVRFVLAEADDPRLPAQSVDLIFICNAYHHLGDQVPYMARLHTALKPGGRIAIVDFYHDERSGDLDFPKDHLVPRETVIHEMQQAGYRLVTEHEFLDRQYFLEFAPAAS